MIPNWAYTICKKIAENQLITTIKKQFISVSSCFSTVNLIIKFEDIDKRWGNIVMNEFKLVY